jgi:tRNA/rRNA methyltransferase
LIPGGVDTGTNSIQDLSVALVEPEFSLNIGYVARVMANFGMKHLLIVSQSEIAVDSKSESAKFASHGRAVLENIKYISSFQQLKDQFSLLIGTTAIKGKRKSNITRKTMDAEECAKAVHLNLTSLSEACIVLGRDTTGLTNLELSSCDYVLTVDTRANYATLNISHAAAIIFYLFSRELGNSKVNETRLRRNKLIDRPERERVVSLFEELAVASDFQKFKLDKFSETMRRLLNRSNPSLRELYLLMGVASKARTKIGLLESRKRKD